MKKVTLSILAAVLLAGAGFANAANSSVVIDGTNTSTDSRADSFCWGARHP